MKRLFAVLVIFCMLFSMTAYADHPISYVPGAYERMEDHMDCGHMWIVDHANHYVCAYCNSYGGCVPVIPEPEEEPEEEEEPKYNAHYIEIDLDGLGLVLFLEFDDINIEDCEWSNIVFMDDGPSYQFRGMRNGKIEVATLTKEMSPPIAKAGDKIFLEWSDGEALWNEMSPR